MGLFLKHLVRVYFTMKLQFSYEIEHTNVIRRCVFGHFLKHVWSRTSIIFYSIVQ